MELMPSEAIQELLENLSDETSEQMIKDLQGLHRLALINEAATKVHAEMKSKQALQETKEQPTVH